MIEAKFPLPLLLAAERIVNQAIGEDVSARDRMATLSGLVFEIHLTSPTLRLYLTPTSLGTILIRRDFDAMPDAQITTSAIGLARLATTGSEGMDALFSGDIRIDGNPRAAESFLRVLNELDIDFFGILAERIGVGPAGLLERRAMRFRENFTDWRRTRQIEQADFLVYERQLLVPADAVQSWMDEVDGARDHVDRLEARIRCLTQRMTESAENRT
ncbi:hypothetical protein A9404_02615 [Halothiobacillus diazotrophicus]|uniref:SCP2 domain-containing protein n=1 Tax=Halothiobacillus diazotrophicus TaxID=1860122 RepID=A0A191ZEX1_9GAMM|nr:SCP2 sterol-binding domain-containing protein [Halothiobacillus diazotrophicus]ANJ66419.1 hypothetical protein A9404_02615 [Halothiobacillus diazotrophicus]